MNTTLAIPTKVTNSVQPPLKKAELIRALAIRKQAKLIKEQAEIKALYQSEDRAITAEVLALAYKSDLSKVALKISGTYVRDGKVISLPDATFEVQLPAEIKKRIVANDARRREALFGEAPTISAIEAQLRAELNRQPSDRVGALLNDDVAVKALDTLLAKIDRRAESRELKTESVNV